MWKKTKRALREYIRSLKKEGDSISMEYCVQHKNGDIIHVMGKCKASERKTESCSISVSFWTVQSRRFRKEEKKSVRRNWFRRFVWIIKLYVISILIQERGYALRNSKQKEWKSRNVEGEELTLEEAMGGIHTGICS